MGSFSKGRRVPTKIRLSKYFDEAPDVSSRESHHNPASYSCIFIPEVAGDLNIKALFPTCLSLSLFVVHPKKFGFSI